jgi:PHYB activation tagged suppressor 1
MIAIFFFEISYLPTKRNRHKWMLEKKLRSTLMHVINLRLASQGSEYGNDLLGLMLEACTATKQGGKQEQLSLSMDEIIHECKTFFFAGYETTSLLLTWTVFLLSVYPEWQERLRKEVSREVGKDNPTGDNLSKLKEARTNKITYVHFLILS